ncbi:MAG TPA: hypothetical protein VFD90_00250 [Gaiellales bacterium]|jgi:hypothetical protein|nr:hypothetical protein [Gaiellales bacterium]
MIAEPTPASANVVPLRPRVDAAENAKAAASLPSDLDLGAEPPADLLLALDRAARVAADLDARRLGVRFETGVDSKLRAQVIDADGKVVRLLPVGEALELLSGLGPTAADELGSESR